MKKAYYLFIAAACAQLLTACGPNENLKAWEDKMKRSNDSIEQAKKVVTPITWAGLTKENTNKNVSIAGYLHVPSSMTTSKGNVQVYLYERPNQGGGMHIILSIPEGTGNNTAAKMGDKYKLEDFKIKTDKGEVLAGEGAYVQITGQLFSVYTDDAYASMGTVTKIEKMEPAAVDYDALNVPEFNNANAKEQDDKLVYATGVLETGMLLNEYDYSYSLTLKGPKLADGDYLFAYVKIGNGPNHMEVPPNNYSNKDIKIHDDKGNLFPLNKKVKVYGVFSKSSTGGGGKISVEKIVVQ